MKHPFVSRLTRRVPLVAQELFTLLRHTTSTVVRVGQYLVFCVVVLYIIACSYSVRQCSVCPSIYGFSYLLTVFVNEFHRVTSIQS